MDEPGVQSHTQGIAQGSPALNEPACRSFSIDLSRSSDPRPRLWHTQQTATTKNAVAWREPFGKSWNLSLAPGSTAFPAKQNLRALLPVPPAPLEAETQALHAQPKRQTSAHSRPDVRRPRLLAKDRFRQTLRRTWLARLARFASKSSRPLRRPARSWAPCSRSPASRRLRFPPATVPLYSLNWHRSWPGAANVPTWLRQGHRRSSAPALPRLG